MHKDHSTDGTTTFKRDLDSTPEQYKIAIIKWEVFNLLPTLKVCIIDVWNIPLVVL